MNTPNMPSASKGLALTASISDEEIAKRVTSGETALFEILMRRHNQRLYRAVRSILKEDSDIEDVMQQTYVTVYQHLSQFRGSAKFSTWLVKIGLNEALGRVRRSRRLLAINADTNTDEELAMKLVHPTPPTPEDHASTRELTAFLESAIDRLPQLYRSVFMLREVEGMSTEETAESLGVSEDVVKTRLHRAKAVVREAVLLQVDPQKTETFRFFAPRCDRVVEAVLARIATFSDR